MTAIPVVRAEPALDREHVASVLSDLGQALETGPERVVLDLGAVECFDSAGMGGVVEGLRRAKESGVEIRLKGMSQPMLDFFSLLSVERLAAEPEVEDVRLDPVTRLGGLVLPLLRTLKGVLKTGIEAGRGIFVEPLQGKMPRLDRLIEELDHSAIGALPIVALIAFLLGLILSMQAWVQLRVWGAELYIADMVGVSVMTEIGPLMTAIVLAARSGSANAAQLGSMVVGEEVDALRQMGVDPNRYLVVPKVLALMFSAVALGVVFDLVAISGGALFAWAVAGIQPDEFRLQLQSALHLSDLSVATLKCMAFGLCVGVVGCALGLRVTGGSQGVGRATTGAVVMGIFMIICSDALFVALRRIVLS